MTQYFVIGQFYGLHSVFSAVDAYSHVIYVDHTIAFGCIVHFWINFFSRLIISLLVGAAIVLIVDLFNNRKNLTILLWPQNIFTF